MSRYLFALFCLSLWLGGPAVAQDGTLSGKVIVGYQGWFRCPDDGFGREWGHWFARNQANVLVPMIDMLPDQREYSSDELCPSPLIGPKNEAVPVFSNHNYQTVLLHFQWMRQYGIDGAAVQRFVGQLRTPFLLKDVDHVLQNVKSAADATGRVFYIEYDASGANLDDLRLMIDDFKRHVSDGLFESRSYAHYNGRPVIAIFGFGLKSQSAIVGAAAAQETLNSLREAAGAKGIAIVGGVPSGWRTLTEDSDSDPRWGAVFRSFDILSPWTVGRFVDNLSADKFFKSHVVPDLDETQKLGMGYLPVVFPGFTWTNLSQARHKYAPTNGIPRRCGAFYKQQSQNLLAGGANMIFIAMFDEVDEGTAIFKTIPQRQLAPPQPHFVTLDEDGCNLPSDFYLTLAGNTSAQLKQKHSITVNPR